MQLSRRRADPDRPPTNGKRHSPNIHTQKITSVCDTFWLLSNSIHDCIRIDRPSCISASNSTLGCTCADWILIVVDFCGGRADLQRTCTYWCRGCTRAHTHTTHTHVYTQTHICVYLHTHTMCTHYYAHARCTQLIRSMAYSAQTLACQWADERQTRGTPQYTTFDFPANELLLSRPRSGIARFQTSSRSGVHSFAEVKTTTQPP